MVEEIASQTNGEKSKARQVGDFIRGRLETRALKFSGVENERERCAAIAGDFEKRMHELLPRRQAEISQILSDVRETASQDVGEFVNAATKRVSNFIASNRLFDELEEGIRNINVKENDWVIVGRGLAYDLKEDNGNQMTFRVPNVFLEHLKDFRDIFLEGLLKLGEAFSNSNDPRLAQVKIIRGESRLIAVPQFAAEMSELGFDVRRDPETKMGIAEITPKRLIEMYKRSRGTSEA